jgi:hypothetical protein
MPSKSRKNRRYSPQARRVQTDAGTETLQPTAQLAASPSGPATASYKTKGIVDTVTTPGYLSHELKWIGIVAAIIVVFLILAYYIFR